MIFILLLIVLAIILFNRWRFERNRKRRREYYAEYLKSDAWQRKRYVVLKRDNCVVGIAETAPQRFIIYGMQNIILAESQ